MLHNATLLINSYQIIITILPYHLPWTDLIASSTFLQMFLLGHCPFCILEADLSVLRNCSVYLIYIIINALVCILHLIQYDCLPLQVFGLINTGKVLQFLDQLPRFPNSKKSGKLNSIYKKLQLCSLKLTACKIKT